MVALCSVLAEFDHGAIEAIPRSFAEGYDTRDRELLRAMYRVSGKPVELNILTPTPQHPMGWQKALEFCRESFRHGVRMHPQFTTNKLELHLKLADTFVFDEMPVWREVLTAAEPERSERLADPACRAKRRAEWDDETDRLRPARAGLVPQPVLLDLAARGRRVAVHEGHVLRDLVAGDPAAADLAGLYK